MNDAPRVSVVLPFYNSKNTLEKAIQSIVNQSFKSLELLLIDNSSTDGSLRIAKRFSQQDSRVKVFTEDRKGVVFAANRGIEECRGVYVARMDADDVALPKRIAKQCDILDKQADIGLVSGLVKYVGDNSNGGFVKYVDWSNSIHSTNELYLNQFVEYPIVNPSTMIRKKLCDTYGGYRDGDFPEDYEYFLRLQSHGVKMIKVDAVVLEWNDLPYRLTRTDEKYSQESFFKVKARYLSKWLKENNPYHPEVTIWGGGKLARKRSAYLEEYGIILKSFIDIKKSETMPSIYYKDIESFKNSFILSFVMNWGAREEIRVFLNQNGFTEGANYLICA